MIVHSSRGISEGAPAVGSKPLGALAGSLALVALGAVAALGLIDEGRALACGCFAPPDPSVPVIQAGERILFAHDNGQVIAHIQIQYSAASGKQFGWLLPLPSIPKNRDGKDGIDVGVDELFNQLISTTQPKYRLKRVYDDCGGQSNTRNAGAGAPSSGGGDVNSGPPPAADPSPLVVQDSVGPYDFAVLKADSKQAMLDWLSTNMYFVPAGTESAVTPYIRPGAYFLALKLKAGLAAGDLQPVVLRYQSDLPMIPIVLTSVGAQRNMGVQVWMLGAGRAIPRNYFHTVINDAQIDWFTAGQNYNDVIIKAVGEADGKHSFVTEYAGSSSVMRNILDRQGRFANVDQFRTIKDPVAYVQGALPAFGIGSQLTSILSRYIPLPAALAAQKVTLAQYYMQIGFFLGSDRSAHPDRYADIEAALAAFDPVALTGELTAKIVTPTLEAGALFTSSQYLTRLYTTISPEDMNKDPVFSYNPSLPDYSNIHEATLTYHCGGSIFSSNRQYTDATLVTPSGWKIGYTAEEANGSKWQAQPLPYSQRIETLREVGGPEVVTDNTDAIRSKLGGSGCSATGGAGNPGSAGAGGALLLLGCAGLLLSRRRRQMGR